ncbi:hypothetical protein [Fundidesulfovibrio soli]|uniref:hypothetical protein n=1 Tax=Fundidesulfovibrio soli TaxID=2922716 RepID=UPI001FAF5028|nr:hypothetical protein [Fundidesulfovibrio soli]
MEKEREIYEEYTPTSSCTAWSIVLGVSFAVLALGMFLHTRISDPPRTWDFGALPDTPAESVYSTNEPQVREQAPLETEGVPRQLPALPWAKPLKKLPPEGYEQTRRFNE